MFGHNAVRKNPSDPTTVTIVADPTGHWDSKRKVDTIPENEYCITRREDGTWTVDEDDHQQVFHSFEDAVDCAREIAGDADLPLTQI